MTSSVRPTAPDDTNLSDATGCANVRTDKQRGYAAGDTGMHDGRSASSIFNENI